MKKMVEYANTAVDRTEGGSPESSGGSKVFRLVGLGFGLLCVMQLALNVSLWRHNEGCFNKSDTNSSCSFSLMPCDNIRALMSEREQLLQENERLAEETRRLQNATSHLREGNRMLNEEVAKQQDHIRRLQAMITADPPVLTCPLGWWQHMSSCYQLSTMAGTWEVAKQSCEGRGAHLVILDGPGEDEVVRVLRRCLTVWTGLKSEPGPFDRIWKWVDGRILSGDNGIQLPNVCSEMNSCVLFGGCQPNSNSWLFGNCHSLNYWMCEKEL